MTQKRLSHADVLARTSSVSSASSSLSSSPPLPTPSHIKPHHPHTHHQFPTATTTTTSTLSGAPILSYSQPELILSPTQILGTTFQNQGPKHLHKPPYPPTQPQPLTQPLDQLHHHHQRLVLERTQHQAQLQIQHLEQQQRLRQTEAQVRRPFVPTRHFSFSGSSSSSADPLGPPWSPSDPSFNSQPSLHSFESLQPLQPVQPFPSLQPLQPAVQSLHPLHPLQFSQSTQQLHQHLEETLPSSISSSFASVHAPQVTNSSLPGVTEPNPSMGVMAVPLSLHSIHPLHPIHTPLPSSLQLQQQPQSQPRHNSLPNPEQVADHFQLFQQHPHQHQHHQHQHQQHHHHHQQQQQQHHHQQHISTSFQPQPAQTLPVRSDTSQSQPPPQDLTIGAVPSSLFENNEAADNSNVPGMMPSIADVDHNADILGGIRIKTDETPCHRTLVAPCGDVLQTETDHDAIRRLSRSSVGSDVHVKIATDENDPMSAYSLEARIIQKKDQLEELSATGAIIPTPIVEEVRTGQQFLIKLHLLRHGNAGSHMPLRFPSLRVGRRVAINTAGEPRTEHEPLTLEIGVHLAKSGQVRKGACAKCCHKYGPHSAILVLLDPLSPSATDSTNYAHIDTTTGSITMLAKVICSSTDHGERGNKDRYIFEFKLKRTSSMVAVTQSQVASSSSTSSEAPEDEGETLSVCFTHPIMCSGHHKAKRAYPNQRPVKVTKAGPTPKTKAIKRYKSAPNIAMPSMETHHPESLAGPSHMMAHNHSGYPSTMTYLPDHLSQAMEPYASRSTSTDLRSGSDQPFVSPPEAPRIIEVRPDRGPIRKRTDVIIRGLYFREGMVPYFGCFPALDISVETANLIVCKAPESSLPGTVAISIYDHMANNFADLAQFTYTDDGETELLVLQLELRLAHRALEYLHKQATGQNGNATDIMKGIPGLAGSPQSGHTMMMMEGVYSATSDSDMPMMTPSQVEDSLLDTLNNLPKEVDISMQLEDGSNLLHLSILLGFNRLAFRLIDEGCDLEALDMYSLTPLMYAVLQRNEAVTRHLVVAGATSSGARTPREFYARLPREIEPTQTMYRYLSVSCTRFFNATISPSAFLSGIIEEQEADMDRVHPQGDGVGDEVESEEWASQGGESESSSHATRMPLTALSMAGLTRSSTTTISDPLSARSTSSTASKDFTRLAEAIQSVDINSPEQRDDEVVKKSDVQSANTEGGDRQWWQRRQYDDIAGIVRDSNAEPGLTSDLSNAIPESSYSIESRTDVNSESGYHSGVVPEVQEYLNRIQMATLPSEGVKMEVLFKRLPQSAPPAAPVSARPQSTIPLELFRTGDSFAIEIKLTTPPSLSSHSAFEDIHSQTQHAGIRFPKEMVRRSNGRQAFVLGKMTYHLNVSIELGDLNIPIDQFFGQDKNNSCHRDGEAAAACRSFGDGIPLSSACEACSKFLHEHNSLSPSRRSTIDPTIYPILQFSVPGSASYSTAMTSLLPSSPSSSPPKSTGFAQQQQQSTNTVNDSGVMELRDGICEVRGRVNCSSLHHLIQRERTKCEAELRQQHRQREERDLSSSPRSSSSKASDAAPRRSLALTDLIDPGYVFKFELVHPISMDVVARYETKPILFQSYSRRRT